MIITAQHPGLAALAEHAELIRTAEVRRCRPLRHDARLLGIAEQVSASVIAALLQPVGIHVEAHHDPEQADACVRMLFALAVDVEPHALVRA